MVSVFKYLKDTEDTAPHVSVSVSWIHFKSIFPNPDCKYVYTMRMSCTRLRTSHLLIIHCLYYKSGPPTCVHASVIVIFITALKAPKSFAFEIQHWSVKTTFLPICLCLHDIVTQGVLKMDGFLAVHKVIPPKLT